MKTLLNLLNRTANAVKISGGGSSRTTKPLVLFVLLFALGVGEMWAGDNCDFWDSAPASITFTANGDPKTMEISGKTGTSDFTDIGTVSSLTISSFWAKTWKKNGNVCQVEMYYAIHTTKNVWGDDSEKKQLNALHDSGYKDWQKDDGTWNQQWLYTGSENILEGLTPGTTYWIDFYFEIQGNSGGSEECYGAQKSLNNGTNNNYHASFTVADAKTTFDAGEYLYLDARNQSNWQTADFNAKFYFKRYDKSNEDLPEGDVTCDNTKKLDSWVYYAVIPDKDYNGKVQVNRLNPADGKFWCTTTIMVAADRSDANLNCLGGSGSECDWTPTWTTYCPPMSDVDLEEDGTTLSWGGDGSSGTPYLIPTGASIKVKATNATKAVDDDNMTIYYQFKKAGTEVQAGSTTASATITASGSTGTKEAVTVEAYNYYNSTSGTHLASNEIYYEVRTPYTISYNAGTGGSGLRASETKLKGVNFATPNSAIFTRTGYTQTGWATSNGGSQLCALGGNYTSDADATLYPVWTANNYTVTLDNREADIEDGTESVSVTFDAITGLTSTIDKPEKKHYDFGGYYTSANSGATLDVQLIDESGNWKKGVSGYTGTNEDNATWVYAGDITLYAKWTEHEYAVTLAISPAGAGTTSPASSTTAKYVTASADITATPSTGYSFREWGFSKTDEKYDVYVSDDKTYSSTDAIIKINAQHNGTLTANFIPNTYTVRFENQSADTGYKGSLDTTVTFNDTINMKGGIEKPRKRHYVFGGYYISTDKGVSLTNTQIIDADGKWNKDVSGYTGTKDGVASWVCAADTVLYAKWTDSIYTVAVQVSPAGAGEVRVSGSAVSEVTAGFTVRSSEMTPVGASVLWKFKEWQVSSDDCVLDLEGTDYHRDFQPGTDNKMKITARATGQTLTAVFEPRFELVGSTYADSEVKGGMPGWSYDGTGVFEVLSTSPVNLTCTCSLEANTTYKFEIRDRAVSKNYGDGTDGIYELIDGNTAHCFNENMDMKFQTTGAAKYVFQINEIDGSDHPYVKLLWPRQVNFGWKYKDADAPLNEGGGGTVTAYVHEGGVKTAVSTGDYMIQGATISFTAHPYNDYDFAGWWGNYSYTGDRLFSTDSISWSVTSENANAYAKFKEKSNTFTATSGNNWNTTANWSKGHVPTQDEAAIIQSPVEVNVTDAKAKRVLLMQNGGHTGQIEIPAGKELVVRATIKKTTDGSTYGPTGYEDINIGSTLANGTGALVMGANDGTNKATVNFAVKAKKKDGHNVNQFIGTPFNDENNVLYNYYGTKIYRFMAGHNGNLGPNHEWKRVAETNDKLEGFYGYNILTNQTTEPVLWMQGTLNRSAEETITGYYNGSSNTENMFANSWVAPIYIPNFENDDFTNIEKTIYIFNAGTPVDQGNHTMGEGTQTTTAAGQYCVVPVKAAEYTGLKVIPAMQAFSVFANGSSPSLKFNYTRLVYNPSNGTATIVPTRAPQRTNDEDAPTVLRLAVTGESGYAAKIVLLERTDFSDNFDDGWDGRFMAGDDAAPQLYAVTPDGNMAINSIPDIEGTLLGFKAGEADDVFTFSFDYDGEALYLYDTQLQTYTRVTADNTYTFATTDGDAHNRFILTHNAPGVATGIEPVNNPSQVTNKMIIDNHLYIFRGGVLYDALGRMIGNGKEAGL